MEKLIKLDIPKIKELCNAIESVLSDSGEIMHTKDLDERVAKYLNLSKEDIGQIRMGNRTEFSYRMAWAKQNLKRSQVIENRGNGLWSLLRK